MIDNIMHIPRTDAVYNMHGYLTKVPVGAIIPLIKEYSPHSGVIVDMFAGSGMTAIAAKMSGRNALVNDISVLGKHIADGYLTEVSGVELIDTARHIVGLSKKEIGWLYNTINGQTKEVVESIRTVWSLVFECSNCSEEVVYYESLKNARWDSAQTKCLACGFDFIKKKSKLISEIPILVVVKNNKQVEQSLSQLDFENLSKADELNFRDKIPNISISSDREMYKRSALEKWNLTETKNFFSQRNSAILFDLWQKIKNVSDRKIRKKLLFCFTAILPRSSKRYQWSVNAPLNASNQNYYIAPVFYEWNVYDLFMRKIESAIKADTFISANSISETKTKQEYYIESADTLKHIQDSSVDLVFTDPPFGSNIFYSDMNLFQEAWLDGVTNNDKEAVIRASSTKLKKEQSAINYKELLKKSFMEAHRILKDNGHLAIVFGNSKGNVWSIAQEAFIEAGFIDRPVSIHILDKGQRSVKGLNSGKENVSTLDLILILKKSITPEIKKKYNGNIDDIIERTLKKYNNLSGLTPSHLYLEVLKEAIFNNIKVTDINLDQVISKVKERGYNIHVSTGKLTSISSVEDAFV